MLWGSSNTQSFGWNIRRSYCVHAESVWIGQCCLREKQKTPSIKGFSTTSSTNKFTKRNQRWEIYLCTQHHINITDTLHTVHRAPHHLLSSVTVLIHGDFKHCELAIQGMTRLVSHLDHFLDWLLIQSPPPYSPSARKMMTTEHC
jgi:hypothetical protein